MGSSPGYTTTLHQKRRWERLAAAVEALEAGNASAARRDASQWNVGWLVRGPRGDLHAAADLLALTAATHADGLGGHLLDGLLLGVSDGGRDGLS